MDTETVGRRRVQMTTLWFGISLLTLGFGGCVEGDNDRDLAECGATCDESRPSPAPVRDMPVASCTLSGSLVTCEPYVDETPFRETVGSLELDITPSRDLATAYRSLDGRQEYDLRADRWRQGTNFYARLRGTVAYFDSALVFEDTTTLLPERLSGEDGLFMLEAPCAVLQVAWIGRGAARNSSLAIIENLGDGDFERIVELGDLSWPVFTNHLITSSGRLPKVTHLNGIPLARRDGWIGDPYQPQLSAGEIWVVDGESVRRATDEDFEEDSPRGE